MVGWIYINDKIYVFSQKYYTVVHFYEKNVIRFDVIQEFHIRKKNSDKEVCKDSAHEYCLEVLFVY